MTDIILAGGARTPFGDFGKSLKDIPLTDLGVHAVKATLARSGVPVAEVDHLVFGNVAPVDQDGLFISRKVALTAGLPIESTAVTVNRACASGSQAIASAAQEILTGGSRVAVAAGGENFSRIAYMARDVRWGPKRGPVTLEDGIDFVYRCPFGGELMGSTAEEVADRYGYERAAMDEWGVMSQARAVAAIESGFLARQVVPIEVPDGKATRMMANDEFPRAGITLEKLAKLKPVFRAGGKVTPGNSSGVTDGAVSVLVADRRRAEELGVKPEARLVGWTYAGVPPEIMGVGPVPAVAKLLARHELRLDDIDYFEINEAFAVVNLHVERELGIPRDRTNLYGGGISIGHPPGATGVRMTITAMHHLAQTGGRYAVVSMCVGGGQGMATLIENLVR